MLALDTRRFVRRSGTPACHPRPPLRRRQGRRGDGPRPRRPPRPSARERRRRAARDRRRRHAGVARRIRPTGGRPALRAAFPVRPRRDLLGHIPPGLTGRRRDGRRSRGERRPPNHDHRDLSVRRNTAGKRPPPVRTVLRPDGPQGHLPTLQTQPRRRQVGRTTVPGAGRTALVRGRHPPDAAVRPRPRQARARPREEEGPILEEGRRYTLAIDGDWEDVRGRPLRETGRKTFAVGPPDDAPVDPRRWSLMPPRTGRTPPWSSGWRSRWTAPCWAASFG